MPVIENENATMFIVLHGLHHSRKIEFELSRHIIYYKSQCQQKAQGLQAVGPHNRANAASARVQPNQQYNPYHRHDKRNLEYIEHIMLKYQADQIKTRCRPYNL